MADEVSLAKGVSGRISKGSSSIGSALSKYASEREKQKKKKAASGGGASSKKPAGSKQTGEQPRQTIFVESTVVERTPNQPPKQPQKALPAPTKALPGGERWEAFKSYVEKTKDQPAVDLTDINNKYK